MAKETYYLFLDESGDHGLSNLDSNFPVFVLCGVLFESKNYNICRDHINEVKLKYWNNIGVILHSRDIRKCEKEFKILFDLDIKKGFYGDLDDIVVNSPYTIIADGINKAEYIKQYGRLSRVYGLSLSFILERMVFYLDEIPTEKQVYVIVEERGKTENKELRHYFNQVLINGTGFVVPQRLRGLNIKLEFRPKSKNINGLQLADLVAYPIARHIINRERPNPAFDLLQHKFYMRKGIRYGLKTFP